MEGIGFILSKFSSALGALLGAMAIAFFWQPKKLHKHGKLAAGAIIGGVAVSAAFTLTGLVARWLGMNYADIDTALGLGFITGLLAVAVISWVANALEKREGRDILEVVAEARGYREQYYPAQPQPQPQPQAQQEAPQTSEPEGSQSESDGVINTTQEVAK